MKVPDGPGVLGESGVLEWEVGWNGGARGWKLGSKGVRGRDCGAGGEAAWGEKVMKAALSGLGRRILAGFGSKSVEGVRAVCAFRGNREPVASG